MRLTRVNFDGFKRLLDTSCNLDGKLIALVGPNEAGKSSVLEGLSWLMDGGQLPVGKLNRTISVGEESIRDDEAVVSADFVLSDDDKAVLGEVDLTTNPTKLRLGREVSGRRWYRLTPTPARSRAQAETVQRLLDKTSLRTDRASKEGMAGPLAAITRLFEADEWDESDHESIDRAVAWLEETHDDVDEDGEPLERLRKYHTTDMKFVLAVRAWQEQMRRPEPGPACWEALESRIPAVLAFGEEDRVLADSYDLSYSQVQEGANPMRVVPHEDVTDPPPALVSLLAIGGTSMRELFDLLRSGDSPRIQQRQADINEAIKLGLSPFWRQASVNVTLNLDGQTLQVHINEGIGVPWSYYSERSDGFRTFTALILFLARHQTEQPPILLIDEAETHLHYDAQADLVNFLLRLNARTIYTTHSPGCLPPDLGTAVRLVGPVSPGVSKLRNDFWTGNEPGLSPLLFAMGAGVAAFSRFRAAVFAEGPSEMILLPTLIRAATSLDVLGYQVVPGLSTVSIDQLATTDHAAVRVAYLVDGDDAGDARAKQLQDAGIPKARIKQLRRRWALEDLVDRDQYLATVNAILCDSGRHTEVLRREQLDQATADGTTVAKAVERLLGGPSKTIGNP